MEFKTNRRQAYGLQWIEWYFPKASDLAFSHAISIAKAIELTRDLANCPANICTPSYMAEQANELAKTQPRIKVTVLHKQDIQELGMGAFLAVNQGSIEEPKLIQMEYQGSPNLIGDW